VDCKVQWERAARRASKWRANRSVILGGVWRAQRRLNDGHAKRSVALPAGRVTVAGCQFARTVDVLRRDPVSFKPLSRVCLFSPRRVSYRLLFSPPPPFPVRVHEDYQHGVKRYITSGIHNTLVSLSSLSSSSSSSLSRYRCRRRAAPSVPIQTYHRPVYNGGWHSTETVRIQRGSGSRNLDIGWVRAPIIITRRVATRRDASRLVPSRRATTRRPTPRSRSLGEKARRHLSA